MLNLPKTVAGRMLRKIAALLMAYCFLATSTWSLNASGPGLQRRTSWTGWLAQRNPLVDLASKAAASFGSAPANNQRMPLPKIFTNLRDLHASMAAVQAPGGVSSSISSNFNATAIPAGDIIWFTAVFKLNGTVPASPVSIGVQTSTIQFTAGSTNYSLNPPDAVITFSPSVTTTTASFDTANNPQSVWLQNQKNPQPSGNTLLQAFAYTVPAGGLPGGIKNVTWSNTFSSDTANISLNWQWAAAVYTGCVNTTYSSDDVKPTDDNTASIYKNSDHAGTPEACKSSVTQGATGGGASNYTGSLSGTASVTPPVASASPVITATINPPPNSNGWNKTNVTVSFVCSDANFAIASCPAPVTVSSEGAGQVITGTVVDQAGGSATAQASATVNLDKTSPSVVASATSSAGSGGNVLTLPVTITFTCVDAASGIASCPVPIQITTAGANQVYSGTATDKAGNTASTSIALNTESSPLAITAGFSPPSVNGWNNSSVAVTYQCTGGVPPVHCPQSQTLNTQGAGQVVSATASDAAGQSSTFSATLNIDETLPTINATTTPAANAAGWSNSDVTISYLCSDALSGVVLCPPPRVVSIEGKAQQISASVSDKAGNTNPIITTINLEKTAPSITAALTPTPNAAGWNKSDVTVNFTCALSVSDIVSCPAPVSVTTEGRAQEISGTVTDQADKSNTATIPVSLDKTPPTIAISTPTIIDNHASITVTYSDTGSGIDVSGFTLLIDGIDHSGEFTATATGATGSTLTVLTSGSHVISASIADLAGNSNSATASFTIQAIPLTISITQPASGTFTNANSISVTGSVTGVSPLTVTVEGVNAIVQGNVFSADVPLGAGPSQVLHVSASDAAGSTSSATVTVNIDRVKPTIIGSISPLPNTANWNNTPVIVNFLCTDDNSGVASCTGPVPVTGEGANQIVTGTVVDKAGNSASTSVHVNIDSTPPVITATPSPAATNGWNNTNVNVTFFCSDSLSGIASCPAPTLVTTEGANQLVTGQATDNAGNTAQVSSISLNIDKTAPTIVQLSTPDHISAVHGGQVSVTVTDNFTVAQVVISVNGTPLGTFVTAPFQANLQVPAGAKPGDTLTVTAVATDEAGNTQTASRGVSVTADGVIVGQVLSDATGLPIQGASVQLISANVLTDTSDAKGRYSFQASDAHLFVAATDSGSTTVEREIFVQPGAGTVAVDARLTPLAAPRPVGSAGGTLTAGSISIAVPPASVPDGTNFQLTALSGQGLPGLLPLGWSPVAAFDLRTSATVSGLPAIVSQLPAVVSDLAIYDPALHAWTLIASNLPSINGSCSFTVPAPGAYALVVPDTTTPPITIPDPGSPLTGIAVQAIDPAASSSGSLNPPMLSPAGGTATATLGVQSPNFAPSGTIIQANVLETFTLSSGDKVSEETRSEDILLYNALAPANSTMGAKFPVTPSRQYTLTQLVTGKVHLDILAGREGVRGQPGGNDPVNLSDGTSTLSVPGGALSQDTAISVQSTSLEDFVPTSGSMGAIQEVLVDFSGETLNTPAQLSIAATGLNPSDTFLLTQVQRINGVPYMVAVALAQINGQNLSSITSPGLPGVIQGGEYVFYDISAPVGFVQGITSSTAGAVSALVLTDSLQIAGISGVNGHYIVPALAGTANLKASAPNTSLAGTASAQVIAGQTATVNIALAGTVTRATVTPADGSLGVSTSTIITISTSAPLNPQSIVQGNLSLVKGPASAPGAPVPLQPFVLSTSGTTLTFAPVSNLDPATQYTIQVSGLADASGGAIAVPTSSFTTKASAALNFDPNAITFAMPDQNGNIHVSAPAGSLSPGTTVLIIDQGNAVVVSFTVLNDGSLSGDFPGTINDVLQVTVTDPNGAAISFTRSQFVAPDGSVAVGPGGGTITGPGNTGLIIPQGTLIKAATFKVTPLDQTAFPQLPTWPGLSFGSGLHIDAPDKPAFNQEVKLAFPVPANAPSNAFYYVYRRLTDQDGKTYFETIDHAFVQGTGATAQVVTASPPFCGYHNPIGNFNIAAAASGAAAFIPQFSPFQDFILMWDIAQVDPNLPGVASPGLIVGLVQQTVPAVLGQSAQTTQPYITNVKISLDSDPTQVAVYDPKCSTFTIFDPRFGGGSRNITATAPAIGPDGSTQGTTVVHAVVDEVNGIQADDATYGIFAGLERQYRNIGRVTITFPATTPPPPPPQLGIRLFSLDGNGHRLPATGILQTGTNLVIAFQSKLPVQSASISSTQLAVTSPDVATEVKDGQPEKLLLDARAVGTIPIGSAGTYTITATALDPLSQTRVTANQSFLAVAPGGSNNTTITCTAAPPPAAPTSSCTLPKVVDTAPLNGATSVSPSVFPQVTFNEPVSHVPDNVLLKDHAGTPVPIQLIGIRPFDSNNPNANLVANPLRATDVITSLTVQPLFGLKYNETYTLTLNAKSTNGCVDNNNNPAPVPTDSSLIIDQNQPPSGPLCLEPFPKPGDPVYKFTTFGPQEIGGTSDQFASTRPVLIGNRAFMGEEINASLAALASVDITDPTFPKDKGIGTGASFVGRPMDASGQATSPVTGGPLVAVAAGQPGIENIIPSNVWIYDVTNPDSPVRVAGVSATTSTTQDGLLLRIFMKDQFLYTSTFQKGLQVIDMQAAVAEYQSVFPLNPTQFGQAITTEGNGFATDTVVNTIPLFAKNYQNIPAVPDYAATMNDVKAADYVTGPPPAGSPVGTPGITQTYMVATGRLPLVIADPQQPGPNAVLYPASVGTTIHNLPSLDPSPLNFQVQNPDNSISTYTLQNGRALALGTISTTDSLGNSNSEQIAAIVGSGNAPPLPDGTPAQSVFVVVNMVTNTGNPLHPVSPVVQGMLGLSAFATDVVIHGNLALVGTTVNKILLVNLVDPAHPVSAGEIDALPGSVFGDRLAVSDDGLIVTSSFNAANGGLHLASLGSVPMIEATPSSLFVDSSNVAVADVQASYRIIGDLSQIQTAVIVVKDSQGNVLFTTPVPVKSQGQVVWQKGAILRPTPNQINVKVVNPDGSESAWSDASPEYAVNGSSSLSQGASVGVPATPIVTNVSPQRVDAGSGVAQVIITGRNLTPGISALVAPSLPTADTLKITTQFISNSQIKVAIPATLTANIGSWTIQLDNGFEKSSVFPFRVVQPGLPPLPSVTGVQPAQLISVVPAADQQIILSGANFGPDTAISTQSSSNPLQTNVISPQQMQVTIPAAWIQGNYDLELLVKSAQDLGDPGIQVGIPVESASVATVDPDYLSVFGAAFDSVTPIIDTVGNNDDGFVPLPAFTDPPTTVKVTGRQIQSGASLIALIDGQEVPLQTSASPDGALHGTLPVQQWSQSTATIMLQTTNNNGQQASASTTVTLESGGFKEFKETDANIPGASSWTDDCRGFHYNPKEHDSAPNSKIAETFRVIVPQSSARSQVQAQLGHIKGVDSLISQHEIRFDVTPGGVVLSTPQFAQQRDQRLNNAGQNVRPSGDAQTTLQAVQVASSPSVPPTPIKKGTLFLHTMPERTITLVVHYVQTAKGTNQPAISFDTSDQNKIDAYKDKLKNYLNSVYLPQTNLQFDIKMPTPASKSTFIEKVDYDGNGDDRLQFDPKLFNNESISPWQPNRFYTVGDQVTAVTPNGFVFEVVQAKGSNAKTASGKDGATEPTWPTTIGNKISDGDLVWQVRASYPSEVTRIKNFFEKQNNAPPTKQQIFVYFVGKLDSKSDGHVGGFAYAIGTHHLFIPVGSDDNIDVFKHIVAHEIGHTLGLHHNCEVDDKGNCIGTNLPMAQDDNDFKNAKNNLMWYQVSVPSTTQLQLPPAARNKTCHIGYRHWGELNKNFP